jgi:hypothetical protein
VDFFGTRSLEFEGLVDEESQGVILAEGGCEDGVGEGVGGEELEFFEDLVRALVKRAKVVGGCSVMRTSNVFWLVQSSFALSNASSGASCASPALEAASDLTTSSREPSPLIVTTYSDGSLRCLGRRAATTACRSI